MLYIHNIYIHAQYSGELWMSEERGCQLASFPLCFFSRTCPWLYSTESLSKLLLSEKFKEAAKEVVVEYYTYKKAGEVRV
jgi:hypothetical protein